MRSRSRSPPSPPSSRHRHHHKSSREHREHRDHRDHGDRHSHHSHRHHSRRDRDRARSPSPSPIRDRRPLVDDFGRERNPKPPRESRHGSSPVRERSRGGGGSSSRRDDRYDRRPDRYKAADSLRARRRSRSRSRSPATNGHRRDRRAESVTSSSSTSSRKKAVTGGAVPKSLLERPEITEADLEGKSAEEQEMLKLMGFGGFETTKGKKVTGNDVSAVNLLQKRKYRQYMNRKGGFNRPLDFVA